MKKLACVRGGRRLFENLSLELHAGQCLEVRGANGSGKSTLLRVAAGLFPDHAGSVDAAASFYLGHKPAVSSLLSPRENLHWYQRLARAQAFASDGGDRAGTRASAIADALQAVGLASWSEIPCGQLSQGQRRRAGLARALLFPGRLWLLDEPLTALDTQGRAMVGRLIAAHCDQGGAVLCATHQPLGDTDAPFIDLGPGD